jgi:hypothetical protein
MRVCTANTKGINANSFTAIGWPWHGINRDSELCLLKWNYGLLTTYKNICNCPFLTLGVWSIELDVR